MSKPFVAVLMGSDSDLPVMESTIEVLRQFEVITEVKITSAHRTPEATCAYVKDAEVRGCAVFIAAAGLAAHLAGSVAALTLKPVIGVPMAGGPLNGIDALLSTVQMPGGVPVACVTIGKAGAKNAGYLAAQILALQDRVLAERLRAERAANAEAIQRKDAALGERFKT
jgi:5-(carboxyamino)imidazole ribonucleotide mutase